jgi:phosphoribosylglycinamide formyltransferase-1
MSPRVRFAVLVSGAGSNLRALLEDCRLSTHPGELALVISSEPDAGATAIARAAGVPVRTPMASPRADRAQFEMEILELLTAYHVEWVVLAGYRWLLGPLLLRAYPDRILNVHPSLLPNFPGLNAPLQAIRAQVTSSGASVHLVDAGMDTGPMVAQARVPVFPDDGAIDLHQRIQEVEHRILPMAVRWALSGRIRIPGTDTQAEHGPRPTLLDGGLATTLQKSGLPPYSVINDWVFDHPEAVRRAHRAFAASGADILLAATFSALPHLEPRWRDLIAHALALAAAEGARVWAPLGPATRAGQRFTTLPGRQQVLFRRGWAAAAARAAACGTTGIALETFVDPSELYAAVEAVRDGCSLPVAACLCPAGSGNAADGTGIEEVARETVRRGATLFGVNCGLDATAVVRAVARLDEEIPVWAKPSMTNAFSVTYPEFEFLLRRCAFVGGCCGTLPADVAALRALEEARLRLVPPHEALPTC